MNFFEKITKCYLIAEIGVNHSGNIDLAKKMIIAAKNAGANAVKFQTFTAESLVTRDTPKVQYQKRLTDPDESHYDMIKSLEFSKKDHLIVKDFCESSGIDFLSTPYDIDSAKFLEELGIKFYKVASADIVDLPLNAYIAKTGKPVLISTGMATLGEIEKVIDIYRLANNANLCLLHCVSIYPCDDENLNLMVMQTLSNAFQLPVGFSDHSKGYLGAVLSVSLGAKVIEKHFTLDKDMIGPDHKASATPEEFSQMVKSVRRAEVILGSNIKRCQDEERQMALVSRKSIVAAKTIPAGKKIEINDICLKRPGTGLSASFIKEIIGRRALCNIPKNSLIVWNNLLDK